MCGPAFADKEGKPIYVCSAILGNAVHPGKAGPHLIPPVRISGGGKELGHDGRYDLLPITPECVFTHLFAVTIVANGDHLFTE